MKQLVIEPCQINYGDDAGGIHQDAGDLVEVSKSTATALAATGRTLYVERKNDPTKTGQYTASKEMIQAAKDMAAARAKEKSQ